MEVETFAFRPEVTWDYLILIPPKGTIVNKEYQGIPARMENTPLDSKTLLTPRVIMEIEYSVDITETFANTPKSYAANFDKNNINILWPGFPIVPR